MYVSVDVSTYSLVGINIIVVSFPYNDDDASNNKNNIIIMIMLAKLHNKTSP